jgi:outer membrane protein TolC
MEQNAADARAMLVTGDESLRQARESLGLVLGFAEEMGVAHDLKIDGIAQEAMTSCRTVAEVDSRSDVAAARVDFEVAKRNVRNESYSFLPTVSARTTLGATSFIPPGYPSPTWSIQGLLSVPIWEGGARYGKINIARAAEDIAAQQLEGVRQRSIIEVEQARRQLDVAEASNRVARQQRDLAAKTDLLTQTAYVAGQGTSLELATASEAHRRAELNLALREFVAVRARLVAELVLATCSL